MMKKMFCLTIAVLALIAFIAGAGCIAEEKSGLLNEDQLTALLDTFADEFSEQVIADGERTAELAAGLASARDANDTRVILRSFYIDNIWLTAAGYYDAEANRSYITPFSPKEADLRSLYESAVFSGNTTIVLGPIDGKENGVLVALAHPVFRNGQIAGAAFSFFDPVARPTSLALSLGGLNGSAVVICDTQGRIFYSPFAGDIGLNYHDHAAEWGNVTVLGQMLKAESGISVPYSGITSGVSAASVKKQGAWKTISFFDRTFRVAVVTEERAPALTKADIPNRAEVDSILRDLYLYAVYNGREETIQEMNNPDGKFSQSGVPVYAFTADGTLLAGSDRPAQVGSTFANWRSAYGTRTIAVMADIAAVNSGGWYTFTAPVTDDPAEQSGYLLAACVIPVNADWFICSIVPAGTELVPIDVGVPERLLPTMQAALRMYLEEGDAAFAGYTDRAGTLPEGGTQTIMAVHQNGTILAFSSHPEFVGVNGFYDRNPMSGIAYLPLLNELSKRGGGYSTFERYDGNTKTTQISIVYLEPLTEDTYLIVTAPAVSYTPQGAGA